MSGGILIHRAYLVWTTLRALPAHVVFAGCVARVPVSLWGTRVEGVFARRCVYVRNRSQPFATVRARSLWPCLCEFCKRVTFGGSKRRVASFRVAGVALCDIPTCLIMCRQSFCVAGAILLRRFHKMSCTFRGRRSTLETSIVILRGRRSTSDVSCCVNRIVRAASHADNAQIPWQAWHCVRRDENGRKPRTKHRF